MHIHSPSTKNPCTLSQNIFPEMKFRCVKITKSLNNSLKRIIITTHSRVGLKKIFSLSLSGKLEALTNYSNLFLHIS